MNMQRKQRDEGAALLLAAIVILAGSLVLGALSFRAIHHNNMVNKGVEFQDCFQGIEAAVAMAKAELDDGEDGMIGMSNTYQPQMDANNKLILPTFDSDDVVPVKLSTMPNIEFFAVTLDWEADGIDNDGDGNVDDATEGDTFSTYAYARSDNVVRRVEVILRTETGAGANDTIFAGGGQAGALINGNVDIHGAVHLLGDNLPEGGSALIAMDLSGTTLISNNYDDLPAHLEALIPDLPTADFNGEDVETLEAKLRVRQGLVSLNGNSHVGSPDVPGDSNKETLDGTYVTDGWTGNSVTDDGGRGDPSNVYSDNGWDEHYDLGNQIDFPSLADPWEWPEVRPLDLPQLPDSYGGVPPAQGLQEIDPNTGSPYSFEGFFSEVLSDGVLDHGDIVIDTSEKFYWNSSQEADSNNGYYNSQDPANSTMTEAEFDALDPTTFDPSEDYLYFDPATDTMYVRGQIEINGNLEFTGNGNDDSIEYIGRAAILAQNDVTLDVNLTVANTHGEDSYPVNNAISVMAKNNFTVGSTSQLELMGAFYAEGEIISEKQTLTVGMFVSNFFDMGSQVPAIYGVPILKENLPFGVNFEINTDIFVIRSWRELGVSYNMAQVTG